MSDQGALIIQEALERQLRESGLDLVDLMTIPAHGDRMVKLRTLQEALEEFDRLPVSEETVSYLITVKRATVSGGPTATAHLPPDGPSLSIFSPEGPSSAPDVDHEPDFSELATKRSKPSLDNIYLPNGKLNLPFLRRNAELLFQAGDYAMARKIYKAILNSAEHTAVALLGIARCLQSEGKLEEARRFYDESIAYQPSLDSYRWLAEVLMKLERHAQAGDALERALALKDISPRTRFELCKAAGNSWTRAGKAEDAERVFNRALELDPTADEIRSNLGVLFLQSNRSGEAKRHFQDALAAHPGNAKALAGLGSCFLAEGDRKAAHDCFASSLEAEINNPTAIYHLVRTAFELRTYATAAGLLEEYVQNAPVNPNLLYSLAGLQFHLGRLRESEATARQVISLAPDHRGSAELLELIARYSSDGA